MASQPIWEEGPVDDDVPLSSFGPASAPRRSKTTASRLQRISNGRLSPSSSLNAPGSSRSNEISRTSSLKLPPGMSRIHEDVLPAATYDETGLSYESSASATPYEHQYTYSNDDEEDDTVLLNPGGQLARHASMPISRAVRRSNNASAPWSGAPDLPSTQSPGILSSRIEHDGRMRSSSTAAAEVSPLRHVIAREEHSVEEDSSCAMQQQGHLIANPLSPVDHYYAQARTGNSGFVVTSRPNQGVAMRTSAGHPGNSGIHNRSASSAGWTGPSSGAANTSPSHSRHASESNVGTPTLQQFSASGSSTPPPASPIDAAILGANNPWSPTAEEKQHFRHFGTHAGLTNDAAEGASNNGVRRSHSLTATIGSGRARQAAEAVRQPTRKNTPMLPPLVTSSEVLHNPAAQQDRNASQTAHPLPSRPLQPGTNQLSHSTSVHGNSIGAAAAASLPRFGLPSRPQANNPLSGFASPTPGPSAERGHATAGPGIPSSQFYRDKERVVGLGGISSPATDTPMRQPLSSSIMSPVSAFSSSTIQFPSLNDPQSTAAFQSNLALQQQLLAQQTAQLQEQQSQLAAALQAGLSIRELPPANMPGLGADPYTIAARIDALQKANAILAANRGGGQMPLPQQQPAFGNFNPFSPGPSSVALPLAGPAHANPLAHKHIPNPNLPVHPPALIPPEVAALVAEKGYNPREFDARPSYARFFVIKSFTEDDVFKSIKFEIWSSTQLGNNRLDKAHKESTEKGPIYLFFSVNASGHFCGVAQMLTPLDYNVTSNVWAQNDKWKGVMKVKWVFIRDIPNPALRHLKLTNTNEQKPVTSSRDTQEIPYEQGCEMLKIFHTYQAKTSLLQDYAFYQQQTEQTQLFNAGAPPLQAISPVQPPPNSFVPAAPAARR